MSPSLKSAFFPVLSALIKVRRQSPAWAKDKSDTNSEHGSQFDVTIWARQLRRFVDIFEPLIQPFAKFVDVVNSMHEFKCFLEKIANVAIAIVSKMRRKLSPELDSVLTCKHLD